MKAKHVFWIFSALVAVVAMAAGVAVIIDKYFSERVAKYNRLLKIEQELGRAARWG